MSTNRVVLIPAGPLLPDGKSRHIQQYRQAVRTSKNIPPLKIKSLVSPVSSSCTLSVWYDISSWHAPFIARALAATSAFPTSSSSSYNPEVALCRAKSKGNWWFYFGADDICIRSHSGFVTTENKLCLLIEFFFASIGCIIYYLIIYVSIAVACFFQIPVGKSVSDMSKRRLWICLPSHNFRERQQSMVGSLLIQKVKHILF